MYETVILKMQEEIEELKNRIQILEVKYDLSKKFANSKEDSLLHDAIKLVVQHEKASASLLQRRLGVGYARAARILDELCEKGIIDIGEGSRPRNVLLKSYEEYQKINNENS